jgi:hypothetical protein
LKLLALSGDGYHLRFRDIVIVVLASFNAGELLTFPSQDFSLRWCTHFFNSKPFMDSLFLSLRLAATAMITSTLLGTGAALYVVRFAGKWRYRLRLLIVAPLLAPEILSAMALLFFFYSKAGSNLRRLACVYRLLRPFRSLPAAQGHRNGDAADPTVRLCQLGLRPDRGSRFHGQHRNHTDHSAADGEDGGPPIAQVLMPAPSRSEPKLGSKALRGKD